MKTNRRAIFVEEYLRDYNATQAAIRAGYAAESAGVEGCRLLKDAKVKKALEKRKKALLAAISEDQYRTAMTLQTIGHFDIRKLYDEHGQLLPVSQWDHECAVAVASVETVRRVAEYIDGEPQYEWVQKVRLKDGIKALEMLGRHQGLFNDTLIVKPDDGVIYLPTKVPVGTPIEVPPGEE